MAGRALSHRGVSCEVDAHDAGAAGRDSTAAAGYGFSRGSARDAPAAGVVLRPPPAVGDYAEGRPGRCGGSRLPGPVTFRDDGAGPAWTGSWTGSPGIPAQPVLSVRFPVSSVQPVRSVHGSVLMVRRRSTVRFRNGAPGHGQFSNRSNERRGTSRKRRSLALIAREAPIAQREPGRQLLRVAVGGRDLAVAVMVVPCLMVGEGVQLLADCGERERSRKSRGWGRSAAAHGTAGRTGCDRGQAEGRCSALYAHA
jgi:hypothetical protein